MSARAILADVASAYIESSMRHEQYRSRGDHDRADDYLAEMQMIEKSVTVVETNTNWRTVIAARRKAESRR